MVTIRDIAKEINVSKSTVALALRNDPRCAQKTREMVLTKAKKMGYSPNPYVSAHMSHVRANTVKEYQGTIAWLTDIEDPSPERPGGDARNFQGALERANNLGYKIDIFSYAIKNAKPKRLGDILLSRGIRGIILPPPLSKVAPIWAKEFPWDQFASVTIGYILKYPPIHRVCQDVYESTFMIMEKLRSLNYRRIGLAVRDHVSARVSHLVKAAYLVDQEEQEPDNRIPRFSGNWEYREFESWILEYKPDALIVDYIDTIKWVERMGFKVPEEVGIATMYHGEQTERVSGSNQRRGSLGSAAIDMIVAQINRNEYGFPPIPKIQLIPGEWYEGETTR